MIGVDFPLHSRHTVKVTKSYGSIWDTLHAPVWQKSRLGSNGPGSTPTGRLNSQPQQDFYIKTRSLMRKGKDLKPGKDTSVWMTMRNLNP